MAGRHPVDEGADGHAHPGADQRGDGARRRRPPRSAQPAPPRLRHRLARSAAEPASAVDQVRNLAVSRIYLDNFDHITAYWVSMGLPLAQVSLNYGVDDLHGTIMEEKIFHMAGAKTPQEQTVETLEHVIREAGREPVQRDSYYRHLKKKQPANSPAVESELVYA